MCFPDGTLSWASTRGELLPPRSLLPGKPFPAFVVVVVVVVCGTFSLQ